MKQLPLIHTISFLFILNLGISQSWNTTSKELVPDLGRKDIVPTSFAIYTMDDATMKEKLMAAPNEAEVPLGLSQSFIQVPLVNGQMETFKIVQYTLVDKPLSDKYKDFRAFYGISTTNVFRRIRIDYTIRGFRAVISDEGGKSYIDHYQRNDLNTRILYKKSDLVNNKKFECHTETPRVEETEGVQRIGDCQFRTYRLAMAANGEYSAFHGNTEAQVLSAVMTSVNRVNDVYEEDVAARFILVGNTNLIFYYNPATDPYTNGNGGTMLTENQTTCTNVIGSAFYDIGHVFSTGGGGVAGLGVICSSGNKARGVTGSSSPVGDAFDIDYVAHEMGHQCGGNHTFNNSCGGNINGSTAFEPGSGTTVMAYAGICPPDIQAHSDAYFHAISVQEIKTKMDGTTCAAFITFNNTAPVMSALQNYTIPISTPFFLTAAATDGNGDPLKYCWEQMDATTGQTMPPSSTNTAGPAFRSLTPVTSPTRYMPTQANVANGTSNTWEVLPSVARTMNFRCVVRDYHINGAATGGCTDEENNVVTFSAAAGPFTITSDNAAPSWFEGEVRSITWNVANTNAAPVSCANVEIALSYDGGYNFPVILLASTANDGSEDIVVPSGISTTARVRVRAIGNIFYDINNSNINIQVGSPTFILTATPPSQSACNNASTIYNVNVQSLLGFTNPVTLSLSGLPGPATSLFGVNPIIPGNNTTLTLSNLSTLNGTYNLNLQGVSGLITRNVSLVLIVSIPTTAPALTSPADAATGVSITPTLTWTASANATSYNVQISALPDFSSLTYSTNTASTSVVVSPSLQGFTTYYWRVNAQNSCGASAWSPTRYFETAACLVYNSTNVPVTIPAAVVTVYSNLNITDRGTVTDLDIVTLTGTHTWIDDLKFSMIAPNNTTVLFWNRPCDGEDNFNINFNDGAANSNWPCPPVDGLTYKPSSVLTPFNTLQMKGLWRMKIDDIDAQDGGSLASWGLKLCMTDFCRLNVENNGVTGPGSLLLAVNCALSGDTITFSNTLTNVTIPLGSQYLAINKHLTIIANPANNIVLTSTSATNSTIEIAADKQVEIRGLTIKAPSSGFSAISNQGRLILENCKLHKFPGGSANAVRNYGPGFLTMSGSVQVKE